jgi:hypothetical protein
VRGDYVAIGAQLKDDLDLDAGGVYVYRNTGKSWIADGVMFATDGQPFDFLGNSVAVEGQTLVAGAVGVDGAMPGSNVGAAYVFERGQFTWLQVAKLTPPDGAAGDEFGASVAIRGDRIFVGADRDDDDGFASGSVYVYQRQGDDWLFETKLTASDGSALAYFGSSVACDGDVLAIGADGGLLSSGSAYVFRRGVNGWQQEQKLTSTSISLDARFGVSIGVCGNRILVGASNDDLPAVNAGSAFVYYYDGATWSEQVRLIASDRAAEDRFGFSVALGDAFALIGSVYDDDAGSSSGSSYVYDVSEFSVRDCNGNGISDRCEPRGDVNGDGVVDVADADAFAQALLSGERCRVADINADGRVDGDDVQAFIADVLAP